MQNNLNQKITIWNDVLPQVVTSSTDATPIVVTKSGHGYSTGDIIMIQGHSTNLAANGMFKIVVLSSSTFALYDLYTGAAVAGSGGGAGSGGVMVKMSTNEIPYVENFNKILLQVATSGTATMTIKVAISQGKPGNLSTGPGLDLPTFGATISPSNPYSLVSLLDELDPSAVIAGGTGIAVTGTDIIKNYAVNNSLQRYFMPLLTSWSAGRITLVANISNQQ